MITFVAQADVRQVVADHNQRLLNLYLLNVTFLSGLKATLFSDCM